MAQISDHGVAILGIWVSDKLDSGFEAGPMQITEAQSSLAIWEECDSTTSKVVHRIFRTASLSYETHFSWLAKVSQEVTWLGCGSGQLFLKRKGFFCRKLALTPLLEE